MSQDKQGWKKFQKLKFDSRRFSRSAKKAETNTARHAHRFVVGKLNSLRNAKEHILLWLLLVGSIIAAVAAQLYWYESAYRAEAWTSGGTYAEGVIGPINTLNPLYATTNAELSASKLIFSSLYKYDETGSLATDLTDSLTVGDDGQAYTVVIRDDAYWSDGKKVTAEDILFTVNLMKSPDVRAVMNASWLDIDVRLIDEQTIEFTLPGSYASFQHALTFPILPKHVLEGADPGSLRQHPFSVSPTGSGPFEVRLLQDSPGTTQKIANLTASDNYYGGKSRLNRFELHAYESYQDMADDLLSGGISAASNLEGSTSDLPPSYIVKQYPINSGVYALFNNTNSVLKDKKIRQALQQATDTDAIRRLNGENTPPLELPFVRGQLDSKNLPKPTPRNIEKAKDLLEKAGWKLQKGQNIRQNKRKQPLQLRVVTVKNPVYEEALEKLAGQWRKIGVDVITEVRDPDNPTADFVQTTLRPRDYDVLVYELVIGADPDVYAYWHSSQANENGFNFANYKSDIADDSLSSARSTLDQELRREKYRRFAMQWLSDVPAIGLYQSTMTYAHRPSVRPYIPDSGIPGMSDRYSNILYWSAETESVYKTP